MDNVYQIVVEAIDRSTEVINGIKESVSQTEGLFKSLGTSLTAMQEKIVDRIDGTIISMYTAHTEGMDNLNKNFSTLFKKIDNLADITSSANLTYKQFTDTTERFNSVNQKTNELISTSTDNFKEFNDTQSTLKEKTGSITDTIERLSDELEKNSNAALDNTAKSEALFQQIARNNGLLLGSYGTFRNSAKEIKESTDIVAGSIEKTSDSIKTLSNITAVNVQAFAENTLAITSSAEAYKKFDKDTNKISKRLDDFAESIEGYARRMGTMNTLTANLNDNFRYLREPLESVSESFASLDGFIKNNIVTTEEYEKTIGKFKGRVEKLETNTLKLKDNLNKQKDAYASTNMKILELKEKFNKEFARKEEAFTKIIESITAKITKNTIKHHDKLAEANRKINTLEQKYGELKEKSTKITKEHSYSIKTLTKDVGVLTGALKELGFAYTELNGKKKLQKLEIPVIPKVNLGASSRFEDPFMARLEDIRRYREVSSLNKANLDIFKNDYKTKFNIGDSFKKFRADAPQNIKAIQSLKREIDVFGLSLKNVYFTLGTINRFINLTRFIGQRFGALSDTLQKPFKEAREAETRLLATSSLVKGNTKENTQELMNQAQALSQVTYLTREQIILGQSQMATFRLSNQTLKDLTNSFTNLTVGIYGTGATQENIMNAANMVGKAFQGQFGQLQRNGILISKQQKEMIKNAKESEKVAIFNQVIMENFGKDFAKIMAQTPYGQIEMMKQKFQESTKVVGKELLPYTMALKHQWFTFVTSPAFNNFLKFLGLMGQELTKYANKVIGFLDILTMKVVGTEDKMKSLKKTVDVLFKVAIGIGAFTAGLAIVKMLLTVTQTITAITALNPIVGGVFATIGIGTGIITALFGKYMQEVAKSPDNFGKMATSFDVSMIKMKESVSSWGTFFKTIVGSVTDALIQTSSYMANLFNYGVWSSSGSEGARTAVTDWSYSKQKAELEKKYIQERTIGQSNELNKLSEIGSTSYAVGIAKIQAEAKSMSYDQLLQWDLRSKVAKADKPFAMEDFNKLVEEFKTTPIDIPRGEGLALDDLMEDGALPVKVKNAVDFRNDKFDEFLRRQTGREAKTAQNIVNNININADVSRENADYITGQLISRIEEAMSDTNTTKGLYAY